MWLLVMSSAARNFKTSTEKSRFGIDFENFINGKLLRPCKFSKSFADGKITDGGAPGDGAPNELSP